MNRSQLLQSIIGDQTQIVSTIGRAVALAIIILSSCWCIIIGSRQSFLCWLSKKEPKSNAVILFINKRTAALIPILISVVLFVHYINSDKAHQEHYSANTQLFAQVVAVHIPVWLSVLAVKVLLEHLLDQYFSCKIPCLFSNRSAFFCSILSVEPQTQKWTTIAIGI
jgi:hypothetical protein